MSLSYSFLKDALQRAGLVPKRRPRGRHRRRREPRACFGELLHIDGSRHPWFALAPESRATLIAVPDDATNRVLYAQFWEAETTHAVMTALGEIFTMYGLPMAFYSDRAGWAFYTPTAKGPVDKKRTDPGRPRPGSARRRTHSVLFPASAWPQRTAQSHVSGPPRERAARGGHPHDSPRPIGIFERSSCRGTMRPSARPPRDPAPRLGGPRAHVDLDQILCHRRRDGSATITRSRSGGSSCR